MAASVADLLRSPHGGLCIRNGRRPGIGKLSVPRQFIVDGLGASNVRVPHPTMKRLQIALKQRAVQFHRDAARNADAAVIGQNVIGRFKTSQGWALQDQPVSG